MVFDDFALIWLQVSGGFTIEYQTNKTRARRIAMGVNNYEEQSFLYLNGRGSIV